MRPTGKIVAAAILLLAGAFVPNAADAAGPFGGHDGSAPHVGGHHSGHGPRIYFGWSHTPSIYRPRIYGAPAAWTPAWYAYCRNKYRSFDPASGTFLGYDGRRHFCR